MSSIKTNINNAIASNPFKGIVDYLKTPSGKKLLISVALVFTAKKLVTIVLENKRHNQLIEKAYRKRRERDFQISKEYTPPIEIPEEVYSLVLNATAIELVQLMNDEKVTSEQVLRIYHNRAITIGLRLELI